MVLFSIFSDFSVSFVIIIISFVFLNLSLNFNNAFISLSLISSVYEIFITDKLLSLFLTMKSTSSCLSDCQ